MHFTLRLFLTDHTEFDNKNGPFDGDYFIWKIKDVRFDTSHLWQQKYSLICTKVPGFISCRFTAKVLVIVASDNYWVGLKTIKAGKRHAISSDVSEKQSVFINIPVFSQL